MSFSEIHINTPRKTTCNSSPTIDHNLQSNIFIFNHTNTQTQTDKYFNKQPPHPHKTITKTHPLTPHTQTKQPTQKHHPHTTQKPKQPTQKHPKTTPNNTPKKPQKPTKTNKNQQKPTKTNKLHLNHTTNTQPTTQTYNTPQP